MNSNSPEVSIIIRTHNEERWISHCLSAIFSQDFDNFEVVLVDNNSTDYTVEVAKRYPITNIVTIDKFFPGKALNDGIRASSGDYIVCISSHCIPKDKNWLRNLYKNFNISKKIAGVYGRQLPLSYTGDDDKRDLLITFGQDRKIQVKDYFFHNANSMLPRFIWNKFPFDESLTNIEDRAWAKLVIDAGYKIIYEPDASVYHHHGLHQHGSSSKRSKGIATILDKLDEEDIGDLPSSLKPENIFVSSLLLVNDKVDELSLEIKLLEMSINELKSASYVNDIYIASYDKNIAIQFGAKWINRNQSVFNESEMNVEKLLSLSLKDIESKGIFPSVILYVNHHYPFRPYNLFDDLISDLQYMGLSSVFPCFVDYGHYWQKRSDSSFIKIDSSMDSRSSREPILRALYGLGCATSSVEIRKGSITGDNIGVIAIEDYRYTLNSREGGSKEIIENLLNSENE